MNLFATRKTLLWLVLVAAVFSLYDVILHSIVWVLHYVFEWLELALEELIEHMFHTGRKQTQVIVFYLLMLMALALLYKLWLKLPGVYGWMHGQVLEQGRQGKALWLSFWHVQPLTQKAKCLAIFALSVYGLVSMAF